MGVYTETWESQELIEVSRNWNKAVSKLYQNVYMLDIRPYQLTRNPSNGSAVYRSRDTDETCDNITALSLVGVLMTCSGRINNIINYIY